MDKFLVIGSNSFTGAGMVNFLLEREIPTVGMSRSPEPPSCLLPYAAHKNSKNFSFHQLDLNANMPEILQLIQSLKPTHIINFAAQSMVAESWQHPEHWMATNVVSHVKLQHALKDCKFLERYVQISTPEVYGNCAGQVTESAPFNPSTPYAVSKAASDMNLLAYVKQFGFPASFTRAANVYGAGQPLYRIIPRTVLFALTGKKLKLHGGGHSVRSFVEIKDVAMATHLVAKQGRNGEIYHISNDRQISIRDVVKMILDQLKVPFEQAVEVVDDRPGKDGAYLLNSRKIRTELNWQDRISLEQGIGEVIAWARENLEQLKKQSFDYQHKE